jgi:hypothetical protein
MGAGFAFPWQPEAITAKRLAATKQNIAGARSDIRCPRPVSKV